MEFLLLLLLVHERVAAFLGVSEAVLIKDELILQVLKVVVRKVEAFGGRIVSGGREKRVESESEGVFQHDWDDSFQHRAVDFKAGIVVDFNEPGFEVPVDHEVKAKYLEVIAMPAVVDGLVVGPDDVGCHFLHLGQDLPL